MRLFSSPEIINVIFIISAGFRRAERSGSGTEERGNVDGKGFVPVCQA